MHNILRLSVNDANHLFAITSVIANNKTIFGLSRKSRDRKMKGTIRSNIRPGMRVKIVLKKDQRSGVLTEGIVQDILTNSPNHPHGIKVRLQDGQVGRVKETDDQSLR
jgi:uncharacterized repeat protein (TIGR03833 family)